MLHPSLYEQVINQKLDSELSVIPEACQSTAPIDKAEASKVLAQYLSEVVQQGLDNVVDNGGDISAQIALTNQIVSLIQNMTKEADFASMGVAQRAEQLLALLRENDPMLGELMELLQYKYDHIDFIDEPVNLGFECPLDLHCTYTRDQLLVALDFINPNSVREGVKWLPEKQFDVLFVTLNKSDKDYSPTTMYNDYSINEELFHWQSQSTTTDTGSVGQRYINHHKHGSKVLLFVREFKSDMIGAAPYTFLGTVNYVKHNGSRPMNVTWRLDKPIPAKYLKKTNKLVVG